MEGTRRSFFATLFAAAGATAIAATAPVKPKPTTGGLFNPHQDVRSQYLKSLSDIAAGASNAEYNRSFESAMERFTRETLDKSYFNRKKIGDTITIKRPIRYMPSRLHEADVTARPALSWDDLPPFPNFEKTHRDWLNVTIKSDDMKVGDRFTIAGVHLVNF